MPVTKSGLGKRRLPKQFGELVRQMPPRAIADDVDYQNTIDRIDRLMTVGKLSDGQAVYLETLVQLVQAYEATHHAIDTSDISGLAALKHLLDENDVNGSDLARLLEVHPSMGSKILNGDRALTIEHVKKLAACFKVSPSLFID